MLRRIPILVVAVVWLFARPAPAQNTAPDTVIAKATQSLQQNPRNAQAYYRRGKAYETTREYDKAIVDFHEAIRLDEQATDAKTHLAYCYIYRGKALRTQGIYDKSIADLNAALRIDPTNETKNAIVYLERISTWTARHDYDQAIADCDDALRRFAPQFFSFYDYRGNAWRLKGEYRKAIADYKEVVRMAPKQPDGYNSLARLWATCPNPKYRNGSKALAYATKACQLDEWKTWRYQSTLAATYAESGNFEEAIKWQEKALELATVENAKVEYRQRLELYRQSKPFREELKK